MPPLPGTFPIFNEDVSGNDWIISFFSLKDGLVLWAGVRGGWYLRVSIAAT